MIGKIAMVTFVSALGFSAFAWLKPNAETSSVEAVKTAAPKASVAGVEAPKPGKMRVADPIAVSRSGAAAAMLPARLLDCHLGRISNFDPSQERLADEYAYEGDHAFRLFLPSIPIRTTEPPRSTQRPEPVDPKTRIVADPDGISVGAMGRAFDRVVDYWPDRVEMTTPVGQGQVNLIILQKSEGRPGSIDIFMTKAKDAVTFDVDHMYAGHCQATVGDAAIALAR